MLGTDSEGETISANTSINALRKNVSFFEIKPQTKKIIFWPATEADGVGNEMNINEVFSLPIASQFI